ncbi:MAG: carbonic anhydrase [Myxococcaceae bacterium]
MHKFLPAAVLAFLGLGASDVFAQQAAAPSWSYNGATGPTHWAGLNADYQVCKLGKFQSPIDIRGAKAAPLPPIEFSYQAAPLHIINNGHSIQVNVPSGSFITVGGTRYELVQLHFHHPSENELNGRKFPMELHLVHKDAGGKLAVVGVLLANGKANSVIAELWKYIPKEKEKESAPDGVTVDPSGLLPTNRAYYSFPGSFTTPPCSEEVTWLLLRTPGTASKQEVATFAADYPDNARPVQPLHGRTVQMSQ